MKLAVLLSGGKDSIYAAYLASKKHELIVLVAIKSENPESYMYHVPNIDLVKLQAKSMNIPLIFKKTKGEKEKELIELKQALIEAKNKYKIEGIISGAILSKYQKSRVNKIAKELGLESLSPLWEMSPMMQWRDMLKKKFKVVITAVAAEGLGEEWLGQEIKEKEFLKLCNLHRTCYVCTGGEGGEYESFVTDCPLFKKKIKILESTKKWDSKTQSGEFIIKKAELI